MAAPLKGPSQNNLSALKLDNFFEILGWAETGDTERAIQAARVLSDASQRDMVLVIMVGTLAIHRQIDAALQAVDYIQNPNKKDSALVEIVQKLTERNQIEQAGKIAAKIVNQKTRQAALKRFASLQKQQKQ